MEGSQCQNDLQNNTTKKKKEQRYKKGACFDVLLIISLNFDNIFESNYIQ